MPSEYTRTGVLSLEDLKGRIPPPERLKEGPVAIVECLQEIPCDACIDACRKKCISKETITSQPWLDPGGCTGCAQCVARCPGLAIFVVDMSKSPEGKAWITIPWEFLPVPRVGEVVRALDREGKDIGPARIVRVAKMAKGERTAIITFEVDESLVMEARSLRLL